jgi:hypothetical protein
VAGRRPGGVAPPQAGTPGRARAGAAGPDPIDDREPGTTARRVRRPRKRGGDPFKTADRPRLSTGLHVGRRRTPSTPPALRRTGGHHRAARRPAGGLTTPPLPCPSHRDLDRTALGAAPWDQGILVPGFMNIKRSWDRLSEPCRDLDASRPSRQGADRTSRLPTLTPWRLGKPVPIQHCVVRISAPRRLGYYRPSFQGKIIPSCPLSQSRPLILATRHLDHLGASAPSGPGPQGVRGRDIPWRPHRQAGAGRLARWSVGTSAGCPAWPQGPLETCQPGGMGTKEVARPWRHGPHPASRPRPVGADTACCRVARGPLVGRNLGALRPTRLGRWGDVVPWPTGTKAPRPVGTKATGPAWSPGPDAAWDVGRLMSR